MKNILQEKVFDQLLKILPTPRKRRLGRKRCSKEALLRGILAVLKYDIPWNNLDIEGVSGTSCWRYFKEIQRRGELKLISTSLAKNNFNINISSIDSSTATSYRFKNLVGFDGKHKKNGTKISVLSNGEGIPYDIEFGKGNVHDLRFVPKHIANTKKSKKKILNMDKGYTSIELRRELGKKKIRVNMEVKKNIYHHKRGRKFKLNETVYKLRFNIEKTFAWLKSFRRVRTRKDHLSAMFKGFVYLAAIIVLIRNLEF
jgi:transposase